MSSSASSVSVGVNGHVNKMKSAFVGAASSFRSPRTRSNSLTTVIPDENDEDFHPELAACAASILYLSPDPSPEGRPIYILNAAAFPDTFEVDYDSLLAYVLARLPGEEELLSGAEYEIVFFAGGTPDSASSSDSKKQTPSSGWYLQAYHVLSRATRKKLQKLYIVHPRTWVRVLINIFGTIVSPKVRRKIVHATSLTQLALHLPIERLLIPPSVYLHDRKLSPDIYVPHATGKRAFGVRHPLPRNLDTGATRLPRVLREATSFLLLPANTKTEGLFRIPPHSVLINVLKEAYDRGQQYIVWKEKGATLCQPGISPALVDEVRLEDAYGVHLAASLIKLWYRELQSPIFPESSYAVLRERYSGDITPEDLVDLILPASKTSPLTETSREILTRHLLPLLNIVASRSDSNKMTSENLAILFSMCLICGSNQLEDGRISTTVKNILQAAIDMWPQLRAGMGIEPRVFDIDLLPPTDTRDSEDPLEEVRPRPSEGEEEGHRIVMNESDGSSNRSRSVSSSEEKPPALPPRRSRAASIKAALGVPSLPKRKPAPHHHHHELNSGVPQKREDAPHHPLYDANVTAEPPRYSSIFDRSGGPLIDVGFDDSHTPANGFGPPRQADFGYDRGNNGEKKLVGQPPEGLAKANSFRRKPVERGASGGSKAESEVSDAEKNGINKHYSGGEPRNNQVARNDQQDSAAPLPSPSETNAMLARMAAQQANTNLAQRITVETPPTDPNPAGTITSAPARINNDNTQQRSVSSPVTTDPDPVFRKPSWPASAKRPSMGGGSELQVPPPRIPRVRAASPGLLKRMSSLEVTSSSSGMSDGPRKGEKPMNLRQTSVDDLRRLYEERAGTVRELNRSRSSASSSGA